MRQRPLKPLLTERVVAWVGSVPSLVAHSIAFIGFFLVALLGIVPIDTMLLVLTTIVSLEAIYLAIFIQMSVNENTLALREVEEDIDEIQEDVEEITEDIDEIQEDVEEMNEEELREVVMQQAHDAKDDGILLDQLMKDVGRVLADLEALKERKP